MKQVGGYYINDEWYQYTNHYNDVGNNTDAGMTQKAITDLVTDYSFGNAFAIAYVRGNTLLGDASIIANNGDSYEVEDISELIGGTPSSVTITMGGTDITSTAYDDGAISIDSVTGNVIITIT